MARLVFPPARAVIAVLALAACTPGTSRADTYLSLGDSLAFGETTFSVNVPPTGPYDDPSNGANRGYTALYANYLGAVSGTAPNVLDLAVDGETSNSFFSGSGRVPPAAGFTDASLEALNTNYAADPSLTQNTLLLQTLAMLKNTGQSVGHVSLSLGSNDLFALALSPAFQTASAAGQQAMLMSTLTALATNEATIIAEVAGFFPQAKFVLIGPYNPFTADPSSPFAAVASSALPYLEQTVASVAAGTGSWFADVFNSPLTTAAAVYTYITTVPGDVHPTPAGYAIIAGAMVPEPSSFALAGLGVVGFAVAGRIRAGRKA